MSEFEILLTAIITTGVIGILVSIAYSLKSDKAFKESNKSLKDAVISMHLENNRTIKENQKQVLEILKPMSRIIARIDETTETYFRNDET